MELNALFTSLVAGIIFLIGFLITGVLSDYKESEKLPSEITASIKTLIDDAYTIYKIKNSVTAHKLIDFQKPVSCHLYPIRITKYNDYDALNYEVWDKCSDAVCQGNDKQIPIYMFVKAALIRKYGKEWFEELDYAAKNLDL